MVYKIRQRQKCKPAALHMLVPNARIILVVVVHCIRRVLVVDLDIVCQSHHVRRMVAQVS
jgi:hypothetical protein